MLSKFRFAFILLLTQLIISCSKRNPCPDEFFNSDFNFNNSIEISFYHKNFPTNPYNLDSLFLRNYELVELNRYVSIKKEQNSLDNTFHLFIDFDHQQNTFIIISNNFTDTLVISEFNKRVIYYSKQCGYQLEIDSPKIQRTSFTDYKIVGFNSDYNIFKVDVFK